MSDVFKSFHCRISICNARNQDHRHLICTYRNLDYFLIFFVYRILSRQIKHVGDGLRLVRKRKTPNHHQLITFFFPCSRKRDAVDFHSHETIVGIFPHHLQPSYPWRMWWQVTQKLRSLTFSRIHRCKYEPARLQGMLTPPLALGTAETLSLCMNDYWYWLQISLHFVSSCPSTQALMPDSHYGDKYNTEIFCINV